jgi:hypothetical protein
MIILFLAFLMFIAGAPITAWGKLPVSKSKSVVEGSARTIGCWHMAALPLQLLLWIAAYAIPLHVLKIRNFSINWTFHNAVAACVVIGCLVIAGWFMLISKKTDETTGGFRGWAFSIPPVLMIGSVGMFVTVLVLKFQYLVIRS